MPPSCHRIRLRREPEHRSAGQGGSERVRDRSADGRGGSAPGGRSAMRAGLATGPANLRVPARAERAIRLLTDPPKVLIVKSRTGSDVIVTDLDMLTQ